MKTREAFVVTGITKQRSAIPRETHNSFKRILLEGMDHQEGWWGCNGATFSEHISRENNQQKYCVLRGTSKEKELSLPDRVPKGQRCKVHFSRVRPFELSVCDERMHIC